MKTIAVLTNDSQNPEVNLTVSGNVEKFVTITPSVVRLNGKIGEEMKSLVKVIPEPKYQFAISKIKAQDGANIKYELKEGKTASGTKEYSVAVENMKKEAGFYHDVLILETDSKIQPEIKINVMVRVIDPNAPANAPLTNSNGNSLGPANGSVNNSIGNAPNAANQGKGKNFLEVIQQLQQQQQQNQGLNQKNAIRTNVGDSPAQVKQPQDPKKAEELKKKFEALIKQAQEKQKAQSQQVQGSQNNEQNVQPISNTQNSQQPKEQPKTE